MDPGMMDKLAEGGALGLFVAFLISCLVMIWKYMQKKEGEAAEDRKKFIEISQKYTENETAQTEVLRELKNSTENMGSIMVEVKFLIKALIDKKEGNSQK